jgi:hypothetical protein
LATHVPRHPRTLKYLQYEFFATSAHAISGVLPVRMEFRPMVEMTPEHLEAQARRARIIWVSFHHVVKVASNNKI